MFQQIILVGYLGKDPEMRFTPNGSAVTNFSVATSRTWKQDGVKVDETTWFRISVWGAQAEPCAEWLKKGSPVLVLGRLQPDKNTGGPRIYQRQDGTSGAQFEVSAYNVKFLPKGGNPGDMGSYQDNPPVEEETEEEEDSIPFN